METSKTKQIINLQIAVERDSDHTCVAAEMIDALKNDQDYYDWDIISITQFWTQERAAVIAALTWRVFFTQLFI